MPISTPRTQRWFRQCKRMLLLALVIGAAIPLFFWLRPEGKFTPPNSPALADPSLEIRLLSWNILESHDKYLGEPWSQRKDSFEVVLGANPYDIICMQEVMPEQIAFFASVLPNHSRYSAGRDDGASLGQHCPIFFATDKYQLRDSGTFWLSPTPEKPSLGWGENVPRICSWVELEDRSRGETFRIYNLHLQLHPLAQPKAARVLENKLKGLRVPSIITGDFNAPHRWPALQVLENAGFTNAETSGALTYHVRGKGIRCLDHILTDSNWRVAGGGVLKDKGGSAYPSDHFGLWADLALHP